MSEDDRAAKAARAKALLKKRQQKKAGGAASTGVASPPASPSLRAMSPAPSEVPHLSEEKADLGDVFCKGDSDANWISSLPRVEAPPSRPPSRPQSMVPGPPRPTTPAVSSPLVSSPPAANEQTNELRFQVQALQRSILQLESEKASLMEHLQADKASLVESSKRFRDLEASSSGQAHELRSQVRSLQQTISTLESNKTSLTESLNHLERKCHETERQLQGGRRELQTLSDRVKLLEQEVSDTKDHLSQANTKGREFADRSREQIQNQQQTISILVSEKASLTTSLDRLEVLEFESREREALLQEERNKAQNLGQRVQELETSLQESAEKFKEQERELQLSNSTVNDLREEADQSKQRVLELEERIQSDDRAERLEESLKNTQERADEFEFQLSKLKQSHSSLKLEKNSIETQLRQRVDGENYWKARHAELEATHAVSKELLSSAGSEKDQLAKEKVQLQSQVDANQAVLSELQQKLAHAASELVSSARQLQIAQADLRSASRRAEEAEKTQKDLQIEGTNLMRSLDEMRPKIVELTTDKAELGNKVDSLEHALKNRDGIIADLETSLEELRDQLEDLMKQRTGDIAQRERDRDQSQSALSELQKAYAELQSELDDSGKNLRTVEAELTNHHRVASRHREEIDLLTMSNREQADEFSSVRKQLDEYRHLEEQDRGFIERAQEEIESLRAELSSAEDEIQRLRDGPRSEGGHASLDGEMLSALRQQHALDLSAAQSQIRALETSVFEAQAKSHILQKRVHTLEDQLANPSRSVSRVDRPFSPSSRSFSHAQNHAQPSVSRSVFDIGLDPETRHKRRVSLGMLKARIDGELAAAVGHPLSRSATPSQPKLMRPSTLTTIHEPHRHRHSLSMEHAFRRPQLDESHIFWCNSCKADLIIL